MKKTILLFGTIMIGLSSQAIQWSNLLYQPSQPYQSGNPIQTMLPGQTVNYSTVQPYGQTYSQTYYPNTYNPYQTQCQGQYINPYQYRPLYGSNNVPYSVINPAISGLGTAGTNGGNQIIRNIGQSVLYSLMRGY